ncbi:HAD hydrolase family protein [Treponema sp. OMZ 840]|uniref:HAD hydrolase family protein n=1 Tax=Treponema sp. OMZ 840 TaxID=244313 RepID=UPI003D8EE663
MKFDKKQIKLITFDFDGTSLQRDQTWISFRNMHALKQCQKRGIICVPCTGRNANMFPPQIDRDLSFRYWVSSGGCRVIDRLTGEILYKQTFTPEETAQLCKLYEGRHIYSEVAAEGRLYFEQEVLEELHKYPVPPHHVWYLESGKQINVHGKLSDFFLEQNIGAEKFNLYGVPEHMQQEINDELRKLPFVEFLDGSKKDIQFFSTHTNRIKAVETLLAKLNLTWDNVMSIGDSMGMDSAMISHAAFGVATDNGDEELKKIADFVTDRSDCDGFALAVEKFIL